MKITKETLKKIIKESLEEMSSGDPLQEVEQFINGLEKDLAFVQWDEKTKGGYHSRQLEKAKAALRAAKAGETTDSSAPIPQGEKDRQIMDYIYTSAYSMSGFEDPEFEAIKDAYMEARESLSIRPLMKLYGKNKLFNRIYEKYQEEHGA